MKLDDRTIELIAVGASVTAGCQPCLEYHADKARHLGATDEEIAEAIAAGRMVRGGSAKQMDKFVEQLADGERAQGSPVDLVDPSGQADSKECD